MCHLVVIATVVEIKQIIEHLEINNVSSFIKYDAVALLPYRYKILRA